jgi:polyisoprenoid-binding protein YceI
MTLDQIPTPATDHRLPDGVWHLDRQRSEISFAVKEMWGLRTVRGAFTAFTGSLKVQAGAAAGTLTIAAHSVTTGNDRRDQHLRSADFFDVDQHPQITFTTRAVTSRGEGLTVGGHLSIGVSRTPLEIPVAVEQRPDGSLRLEGHATVSRKSAGLGWNKLGMVRDEAQLHARLTLVRASS